MFLATLVTVPFVLGMTAPGWRTVIGAAVLGVATLVYLANAMPGWIFSTVSGSMLLTGLIVFAVGIATRAVTLLIAPASQRPVAFAAVALTGYLGILGYALSPLLLR